VVAAQTSELSWLCFSPVQVVDDILDFTQTAEQLGKPQGQDLASGNLTAPVIFALQQSKELEEIIQSECGGMLVLCTQVPREGGFTRGSGSRQPTCACSYIHLNIFVSAFQSVKFERLSLGDGCVENRLKLCGLAAITIF